MNYTTDSFIEKVKSIFGDKYDYSKIKYTRAQDYVTIICPIHGEFKIKAYHLLNGTGCRKCADELHSKKMKERASRTFIEKSIKVHGNKYDYSRVDYKSSREKVCIICPIHGEFYQKPHEHLSGNGCQKCGIEQLKQKLSFTKEQFIQKAKEIHGEKYDYSKVEYINFTTPVKIICSKHGIFEQLPVIHLCQKCGCPKCILKSQTNLFDKLVKDVPQAEFEFEITSKKVPWLGRMRLDIYSPILNMAIEYDGIQHFKQVNFRGYKTNLDLIKNLDKKKEELCNLNNCELFRINYNYSQNDYDNLINIIQLKLNCCTQGRRK